MRRLAAAVASLAVLSAAWVYASPSQAAPLEDPVCPSTLDEIAARPLIVCGSVGQIYVANAPAGAHVEVSGPSGHSAVADDAGGLLLRDVGPGDGYVVTIGDAFGVTPGEDPASTVTVLGPGEHPLQEFYDNQVLAPEPGYLMTRDNTWLSYNVALPAQGCDADNPCDVAVTYSGYTPGLPPDTQWEATPYDKLLPLGYAVVGVNMRGSGCSGGAFDLMEPLVWLDGYDIVEALSAQPWVEDLALVDKSWPGLSQLYVASTQPPSLDAIAPGAVVGDFYRDVIYPGGIQNTGFGSGWAAGRDATNAYPSSNSRVNDAVAADPVCAANQALRAQNQNTTDAFDVNRFDGEYWHDRRADVGSISVPTLLVTSWQDEQTGGRPARLLEQLPATTPGRLVATNGGHGAYWSGKVWAEVAHFLDVYLDGDPQAIAAYEAEDPITILLETDATGEPRATLGMSSLDEAGDGERLVLGEDLVPDQPDAPDATASTFNYEPGPALWPNPVQNQVSFTSAPLAENKLAAGSGSADLWVTANGSDVDLRVTLSEIRADGKEQFVQSGWLRASARKLDDAKSTPLAPWQMHTASANEPLAPGVPTELRVELFPFAHAFRKGSRVRLTVDGAPGPGPGPTWLFDAVEGGLDVTVAQDDSGESALVLPVVQSPAVQQQLEELGLPDCGNVWMQPCRMPIVEPGNAIVAEAAGGAELLVPVRLSYPAVDPVVVEWETVDTDAEPLAGSDYSPTSGTVTFEPGETQKTVGIDVLDDCVDEPGFLWGAEWLGVQFSNPTNATLGADSNGVSLGLILDNDDPAPVVKPGAIAVQEGDVGIKVVGVPVTLSSPAGDGCAVTANWHTVDSAQQPVPDEDYESASGQVVFAPGQSKTTVPFGIIGDTHYEQGTAWGAEWAAVQITNAENATIDKSLYGLGLVPIQNDD